MQCCFNLLNPSAGASVPEEYPFQDYGALIDRAAAVQTGVIAIRVLAGGALSGSAARHANAAETIEPIATSATFAGDVARAGRFRFLERRRLERSAKGVVLGIDAPNHGGMNRGAVRIRVGLGAAARGPHRTRVTFQRSRC